MSKVWLGSIFLKEEDGYKIILKALEHYKKRLRNINSSPELAGAAMFSQIVTQEAMKQHPIVDSLIKKIPQCLESPEQLNQLENDIELFVKSLESYKADLKKAQTSDDEFYKKLVNLSDVGPDETNQIDNAILKIQSFDES